MGIASIDALSHMTKVFIIAGEESGDQLGAAVMKALRAKLPGVEFRGIGGDAMLRVGLENSLFPMSDLSIMGLVEVMPKIPKLLNRIIQTVTAIKVFNPDIVLTIDSPDFSFRVQRELRTHHLRAKQIHFVAPTVWAWRPERAKKITSFLDGLICLFPFEPKYFDNKKMNAVAVGHPLMKSGALKASGSLFRKANKIGPDQKVMGLFFGSRKSEFDRLSSIIIGTAKSLQNDIPDLKFVVPTLPRCRDYLKTLLANEGLEADVVSDPDQKWHAIAACDAALAVSGTVGLEIAVTGVPHAILYRMNAVTWEIVRRMVTTKHAHLVNILLQQAVVPEFIQEDAGVDKILPVMKKLLTDPVEQDLHKKAYQKVRDILQPDPSVSPAEEAASFIQTFLE